MRTYDEAIEAATDGVPFSNGTEGMCWQENWCDRCIHDKPFRDDDPGNGCPLLMVAFLGKTPSEWMRQEGNYLGDKYHCIEFRGEDEGPGPEPQPVPDPPGMDALIPREPYTGPLMFTANVIHSERVAS